MEKIRNNEVNFKVIQWRNKDVQGTGTKNMVQTNGKPYTKCEALTKIAWKEGINQLT